MIIFCISLITICILGVTNGLEKPQQIHLSLTKDPTEMAITWVTFDEGNYNDGTTQKVEFRKAFTSRYTTIRAHTTKFINSAKITRYVHRATMTGLNPGESYVYQVGVPGAYSAEFTFQQLTQKPPYRICVFGDLGVFNGELTQSHLVEEAEKRSFDLIIHVGDIAYDLFSEGGTVGDTYFNKLQPLFATVPYMVIAGNHEEEYGQNYTTYKNLFTMPNEGYDDNQFYSFDLGPIHFIGLSSEYYGYYYQYGMEPVFNQYTWLENDLKNAVANRAQRPWIIVYHHRPFYCSNDNSDECNAFENRLVRDGFLNMPGLEKIFMESNIDIAFWGHEHSYERFLPRSPESMQSSDPYRNPKGPIYIISGAAGCHSGYAYFAKNPVQYSAARYNDYGYSRMIVSNNTHIHFEQFSVEKEQVIDSVWIVKENGKNIMSTIKNGTTKEDLVICHPKDMHCHLKNEKDKYDVHID